MAYTKDSKKTYREKKSRREDKGNLGGQVRYGENMNEESDPNTGSGSGQKSSWDMDTDIEADSLEGRNL